MAVEILAAHIPAVDGAAALAHVHAEHAALYAATGMVQVFQRRYASRASYGDDDLSPGVTLLEIADGLRDLGQRVGPVDHRRDFP